MRILLADPEESWAGGELQVELLARGLRDRGAEVHVAASRTGALAARLGGSFPIAPLRMPNDLALAHVPRLAAYCRRYSIDVIDAHTARAHAIGFVLRLLRRDLELVVHRHIDLPPRPHVANRMLYLSRAVDQFVAVSAKVRDVLYAFGVDAKRIAMVRSTVDPLPFRGLDRSRARCELGVAGDCLLIGSVAQLAPYKGHMVLLDALQILAHDGLAFRCLIAGEGKLRPQLQTRIAELGLSGRVVLAGFRHDVPTLMAAFDVFVMPSLTEGLGLAVIEAFHAGTPVVASSAGGIPELVHDGVTGLLSPSGDARALAANLAKICGDPALRDALASAAQRFAREECSLDKMIDGNLAVYRRVQAARSG